MKNMLKYDLVRVLIMVVMALLSTAYAIYEKIDIELVVKSYLFLIPIITFLRNIEYLPQYGMKKVLIKESIIFGITLVSYFAISFVTCKLFYNQIFKVSYIAEIFVLFTVYLVMCILIFIKSNYKKFAFVSLMILLTTIILIMQKAVPEKQYIIYILYLVVDIILFIELFIFAKKYENDIYLKK